MSRIFVSRRISDTGKLARLTAIKSKKEGVERVYALVGDLGSGKTTFVQAFLRALGIKKRITSPTFLIVKSYDLKIKNKNKAYHIDAYRIKKISELTNLGFKKIVNDLKNIVLVEWADRIKRIIPKSAVWIYFEHGKNSRERIIKIKS